MSDGKEPRDDLSPAEAAFVEFLAEQDRESPVDFESFVPRHRAHESELRRLHDEWLSVARVLRRGREDATPRHDSPHQLEELVVESEGEGLKLEFAGELVRRLARTRTTSERYLSRGEIARGGMGVIYRIWDPHLRRDLAMKVILARRDVTSPEERSRAMHRALARFLEEAQVTSQLDHPGIVPVHDLGIDAKGRVFFTMRLVKGRDFRRILELVRKGEEKWTLARALGVLLKVCEAVAYAHSKGVIHRDLKPANVMVGRFGEVYVMDWGLARVLGRRDPHEARPSTTESTTLSRVETDIRRFVGQTPGSPLLTIDGRIVGTPSYMSPEQAKGRIDELGPRTDVYAIGAMLYHLLTRQMPYLPRDAEIAPANIHAMLLAGPPAPVKSLEPEAPDELVAICEKAMARDPGDRYATPLEIAADVEAFLDRRPVRAHEPSIRYVASLWFERNRTLSLTVAAASVLLAAILGMAWWNRVQEQREKARLLDLRSARALVSGVDELFPAVPERVPSMDVWLAAAKDVVARAPGYRAELARAQSGRVTGAGTVGGADSNEAAHLEPAVRDMDRLERELVPQVETWRTRAADLARVSLEVDDRKWREAIADVASAPIYDGLTLGKQLGLVPLRKDPDSGLWEFWHVLSGERPAEFEGRLAMTEASGIVLVLVPGAEGVLGYPPEELLANTSSELHAARVEPCFVGKYEVTQAQWARVMGSNPALYQEGLALEDEVPPGETRKRRLTTLLHPVESVNWDDCARFLRRLDLELPGEDAWELAARGGARGVFWWEPEARPVSGPIALGVSDLESFRGRENVADACAANAMGFGLVAWEDGYMLHAPVGTFAPNGFGLHDVLGNVSEWCRDEYRKDGVKLRRIVRGGNWFSGDAALHALSARGWDNPLIEQSVRGLRVARSIR